MDVSTLITKIESVIYENNVEAISATSLRNLLEDLVTDIVTEINKKSNSVDLGAYALRTELSAKANASDVYTKSAVDTKLQSKAEADNVTALLAAKANAADVYTKSDVNSTVDTLVRKTDMDTYAKKTDVPGLVDLSTYAKKNTVDALTTQMANKLDKADASEVLGMENYALKAELDVVDGKVDDKLDVTSATTMLKKADLNTELTRLGYINASQVDSRISSQATLSEGVYLKKADLLTEVGKDTTIARKADLDGLATKLELSDEVNTVNTTLRAKADVTALQNLSTTVAQKSDESSVSARIQNINTALNGKVSVSELNNYITRSEANQIYVSKEDQTIAPDDSEPKN